MRNSVLRFSVLALAIAFAPAVHAANATTVTGTITKVSFAQFDWNNYSTTSPAYAVIHMAGIPGACGQSATYARVAIGKDNPLYESVVAAALTAKASNQAVVLVYLDTCTVRPNAWDFGVLSLE